jgi:glucose/arabinose dehydrogenase
VGFRLQTEARPLDIVSRIVLIAGVLLALLPASALAQAGVSYQIPPDNPFVAQPGAAPEAYAYGLRNPFRFSFDRQTGDLLIGDVGQGTSEEIDWIGARAAAGANFGWACREGKQPGPKAGTAECPVPDAVEPLFEYPTTSPGAVIGGHVVRDPGLVGLVGRYLFADFYDGAIHSLRLDRLDPDDQLTGLTVSDIGGFGADAAGRLYITDLAQNQVFRLVAGPSSGTLATDALAGTFSSPVAVAGIPGDPSQLLVAEKGGKVRLVLDGAAVAVPFVDVTPFGLTTDGERGLLGVAAAPDSAASGKVYVYYTDGEGDIRIDEFRRSPTDPTIADPSSRRSVLEIPHRDAANHNGGTVQFGPDGCLWTATGDGGGGGDQFNNAQNLGTLLGKVLRIDPDPPGEGGPVCRFGGPPPAGSSPPLPGSGAPPAPLPAGSPDTRAPLLRTRIPRRQRVLRRRHVIAYARCDEPCRVSIRGVLRIGRRRYALRGDTRATPAGRRLSLRLRLTRRARRVLRRALRHRNRRPHVPVRLWARDAAGNRSQLVRVTVRVRR